MMRKKKKNLDDIQVDNCFLHIYTHMNIVQSWQMRDDPVSRELFKTCNDCKQNIVFASTCLHNFNIHVKIVNVCYANSR